MMSQALLAFCLTAGLFQFVSPALHAEEAMAWTVNRYESDMVDVPETVMLQYGIPETDAVAFEATCGGPISDTSLAVFWYDVVDFAEGEEVVLSLSAGDFKQDLPGTVFGKDAEVGIAGVEVKLEDNDALLDAMMAGGELTYGVSGGKTEQLHLDGAARAVLDFRTGCSRTAQNQPGEQKDMSFPVAGTEGGGQGTVGSAIANALNGLASRGPASTETHAEAISCDRFGKLKSAASKVPVSIVVANKSDGYRGLMWIDQEGTPVDHAVLNQGEVLKVPTYAGHVWMISDGAGNCLEMFSAAEGDTGFTARASATALGPDGN